MESTDEDDSGGMVNCAVSEFDDGLVDLLAWIPDAETRVRTYVHPRQHSHSMSEEVAEGTGLHPSTAREVPAELADDETAGYRKRKSSGMGNNPYECIAIASSDLAKSIFGQV